MPGLCGGNDFGPGSGECLSRRKNSCRVRLDSTLHLPRIPVQSGGQTPDKFPSSPVNPADDGIRFCRFGFHQKSLQRSCPAKIQVLQLRRLHAHNIRALFHFVGVRLNLDNSEEYSGMDEATSEDLAFPSRPQGNPTESNPRTV